MNGRIYDPKLGRFMQADPVVQAPKNSQNLNRYSYVLNNPLSYTDPTGFSFWKKIRPYVGMAVMIVGMIIAPELAPLWGGLSGYINSGNIKGAVIGAFSAAMFQGIGNAFVRMGQNASAAAQGWLQAGKILAHGVAGGIMSELNGGKFGHGFWAAGFTQAFAGPIGGIDSGTEGFSPARVVAAAIVGGTASELSGGKFANGAMTGAFSRAFNDELHKVRSNYKLHLIASTNGLSGHVTIAGESPNGTITAKGFYPNDHASILDMITGTQGQVVDDRPLYDAAMAGESGYAVQTLAVSQLQHDAALQFMSDYGRYNEYDLLSNSCVTAALSSFNAAGVSAFNTNMLGALPISVYTAVEMGLDIPRP